MHTSSFTAGVKASQSVGHLFTSVLTNLFDAQVQFGNDIYAAGARVAQAACTAKIPEDVLEAALREQEGLIAGGFNVVRANAHAVGELASAYYAGLVQTEVLPRSLLQSSQVAKVIGNGGATAVHLVDQIEAARRKVVEPFGFPAPKAAAA